MFHSKLQLCRIVHQHCAVCSTTTKDMLFGNLVGSPGSKTIELKMTILLLGLV